MMGNLNNNLEYYERKKEKLIVEKEIYEQISRENNIKINNITAQLYMIEDAIELLKLWERKENKNEKEF